MLSDAEISALCKKLDTDRSGGVSVDELVAYIFPRQDAMGGTAGQSEYEQVVEAFRRHDVDRNGTLDIREFHRLMCSMRSGWDQAKTDQVFNAIDKDHNGYVESDELIAWMFGVPSDRRRARREAEKAKRRADRAGVDHTPHHEVALVMFDFWCGEGQAEFMVDQIDHKWKAKLGGQVGITKHVSGRGAITKVTARNGAVVFWDSATMLAYRENPFLTPDSTNHWCQDMIRRHIPRLISGT